MAESTSKIIFAADGSGAEATVAKLKKSLADLGISGSNSGKEVAEGIDKTGRAAEAARGKVKSLQEAIDRARVAQATGAASPESFALKGLQRGVSLDSIAPQLAQLDALRTASSAAGATIAKAGTQFNEFGLSAKQTSAALRQVPAQLTDIFVSLQGGQAPLTVLLQQGGQLKDIFGGIRPAAAALGSALLGLINPFTVAAAAAVALGLAYKAGSAEADAYAKAIILSGNAAGTTVGQLQTMARAISASVGTQAAAAEALALFAASGDVANASLQRVAEAAIRLERAGGQAVAKTVEQFSALAKEPLAASIKINESTRFLTTSLYQQVKALEDVGRTADAAAVAQRAYAESIDSRSDQIVARLGFIERAWLAIKDATKAAVNAALDVGRPQTEGDQIASAQARIANLQRLIEQNAARGNSGANAGLQAQLQSEQARVTALSRRLELEDDAAVAAKASADQVKARIEFDKEGLKYLNDEAKLRKAIAEARNQGLAAGATAAEIAKREADIRASFAKKSSSTSSAATPLDTGRSDLAAQIALIKNQLDQEVNLYRNAESILEALRAANLVSESVYYERKREFIAQNQQANDNAARDEQAALEAERDRLAQKRAIVKTDNDRTRIDSQIIDLNRQIADSESKRLEVAAKASAQIVIFNLQEKASRDRLTESYIESQKAAENLLATFQLRQDRAIQAVGQGDKRREFNSGLNEIEDRASQRRQQLESERRTGQYRDNEQAYRRELDLLERTKQAELAIYVRGFNAIQDAQGNFNNGAIRALENYVDAAGNAARRAEDLFTKAFDRLEDVLSDFLQTGKFNFKSLGDFIAQELSRATSRNLLSEGAKVLQEGAGKGGLLDGLGKILGPSFGVAKVPDVAGAAGKAAADTAATAATTAATAATTAATAATTALTASVTASTASSTGLAAAETAAAAAIAAASVSSAAALAALTAAATAAAAALATVGASSSLGFLNDAGGLELFGSLGFAEGGRPPVGRASWVGEKGPELFIPDSAGTIVSNKDSLAAMAGRQSVLNVGGITINVQGKADSRDVDQVRVAVARGLADVTRRRTAG